MQYFKRYSEKVHFLRNSCKKLHSFPVQNSIQISAISFQRNYYSNTGQRVCNALLPPNLKRKTTQIWVLTPKMSNQIFIMLLHIQLFCFLRKKGEGGGATCKLKNAKKALFEESWPSSTFISKSFNVLDNTRLFTMKSNHFSGIFTVQKACHSALSNYDYIVRAVILR